MARRRRSALAQAQADAQLTYGPQRRDLGSALADAGRTRSSDIRAAQISGGALAHQIRQSLGPLGQDYALASRVGDVNNNDVLNALAGQSGVGGYLASIRGDRALNATLSARELANAKGSLRLQANQALQGAVNDVANVRSNYASLAGKIRSQLSGLSADQAKYVALHAPEIARQQAADARSAQAAVDAHRAARDLHRQRSQLGGGRPLSKDAAGILGASVLGSPQIGKVIAPYRNVKVPPAVPKLTPAQQGSVISQIHQALAVVNSFKRPDYTTLRKQLLLGDRVAKIPKVPGAGPVPSTAVIQGAFDLAQTGRLSRASYQALYGVPVPRPWHPYTPRQRRNYGLGAAAVTAAGVR